MSVTLGMRTLIKQHESLDKASTKDGSVINLKINDEGSSGRKMV